MNYKGVRAATRWEQLRDTASIKRAEEFAKMTLPYIMRDPLQGEQQDIEHDFQSIGAVLTNNLAAKLVQALFPTGIPFFRSELTDAIMSAADEQDVQDGEVAAALAQLDRKATQRLFMNASLAKLTRIVKLLIITGNALLYRKSADATLVCWSMHSYSVRRDPTGKWQEIVLKQKFKACDLDPEYLDSLRMAGKNIKMDTVVDLYTYLKRSKGTAYETCTSEHEIDGVPVGKSGSWPEHLFPYICPTWNLADGEHYGRGHVEDHVGDFAKLSLLSERLGLYELESLDILNVVNEQAGAVVDDYQDAETGDYVPGGVNAVTAYERGDYNKITAVNASLSSVISRLSMAFMYTGNTRDAERVTAEEIRQTASEAEATLGGVYSLLAEGLQGPLAYVCLSEVSVELLQGLIDKSHKPTIQTGIPALSRSMAVQNLINAGQVIVGLVPALKQVDRRFSVQKMVDMVLAAYSVDSSALFQSPEELAKEAAQLEAQAAATQAQQQQLVANAGAASSTIGAL
jgi:hypothetical protein